jgi:hypothetical protein
MQILGLAGRKESTEAQMRNLLSIIDLGQSRVSLQQYGFWDNEADSPNPDVLPEAEIAAKSGAELVVAKSFGTLVTLVANERYGFKPAKCVFIATPLRRYEAENRVSLLEGFAMHTPILFIQQTDDFNGKFSALESVVGKYKHCTVIEVPGNDHVYGDVKELKRRIEDWYR